MISVADEVLEMVEGFLHTAHSGSCFKNSCCAVTEPKQSANAEMILETFIVLIGEGVIRLWTTTVGGSCGHSYGTSM